MRFSPVAAAIVFAGVTAASAQAGCMSKFSRGVWMIPYDAFMAMTANSGLPCSTRFTTNGYMTFESIKIAAHPRNGTAATGDGYSVVYRSSPGFKGRDRFTVAIGGTTRHGKRGTSNIRIEVAVD